MTRRATAPQRLAACDLDAVVGLSVAVGWPHQPPDIASLIDLGRGHVIRDDDHGVVAAGLWWSCGAAAATLGMIIVSPERQGRGLGRTIVEHLLEETDARSLMLTATDAGRPLYERLGFRTVRGIRQVQGECTIEAAADPRTRRAGAGDRDAILALDAAAFGAPRHAAMRHVLDSGEAWVFVEGGTARGFAVRRPFGRGEVIGPIVARDEDEAAALFRAAARRGFIRVDRLEDAPGFAATLAACGLAEVDAPVTMVRGEWPDPRRARCFGLINQALC